MKIKKQNINEFKIILKYQSSYKPLLYQKNTKQTNIFLKKLYIKNYIYLYLIFNFFNFFFINFNFNFFFFKKKKYFKNVLRSPNRHKKAQTKLSFLYYFAYLKLNFKISKQINTVVNNNNAIYKINHFFFWYLFLNKFFFFFESSLLLLQKKKFISMINYEI